MIVCARHGYGHPDDKTCQKCERGGGGDTRQDQAYAKLSELRLDMSMRPSKEDLDKTERKRRRNDLAKEVMKLIIQKSPHGSAQAGESVEWVFSATAAGAYKYADAMLAASGD